jgi:hypothetical protein
MPTQTYTPIAIVSGTGSSDTISFTSIPATYTDLVLVLSGSLSTGNNTRMRFNNNTSAVYSMTVMTGDGSGSSAGVGSYNDSNQTSFSYPGYYDTAISMNIINLMNYSNTTTNKTFIQRNSKASNQAQMAVGLFRSTSAISRVDIYTASGATWTTSTKATLYGIKAGS